MSGTNCMMCGGGINPTNGTWYMGASGGANANNTVEAAVQAYIQSSGILSEFGANYWDSDFGGGGVVRTRIGAANGNSAVTLGNGGNGTWVVDNTHQDLFGISDLLDYQFSIPSTFNAAQPVSAQMNTPSGQTSQAFLNYQANANGTSVSTTTQYGKSYGSVANPQTSPGGEAEEYLKAPGDLSYLTIVTSVTPTGTVTVNQQINGSNGNQAVVAGTTPSAPTMIIDNSHLDVITPGTLAGIAWDSTTNTGAFSTVSNVMDLTTSAHDLVYGFSSHGGPGSLPLYNSICGEVGQSSQATETEVQTRIAMTCTANYLRIYLAGGTTSCDLVSRNNLGAGNMACVYSSGAPVYVIDNSHEDTILGSGMYDTELVSGTIQFSEISVSLNDNSYPPPTETKGLLFHSFP